MTPEPIFKVGETYKTRGGWDATVASLNGQNQPLIVMHKRGDYDAAQCHYLSGAWTSTGDSNWDLLPPPKPKKRVPLEAGDVPPGSVVRRKEKREGHWMMVAGVSSFEIETSATHFAGWETLMRDYEILRPNSTQWEPASKEVDA